MLHGGIRFSPALALLWENAWSHHLRRSRRHHPGSRPTRLRRPRVPPPALRPSPQPRPPALPPPSPLAPSRAFFDDGSTDVPSRALYRQSGIQSGRAVLDGGPLPGLALETGQAPRLISYRVVGRVCAMPPASSCTEGLGSVLRLYFPPAISEAQRCGGESSVRETLEAAGWRTSCKVGRGGRNIPDGQTPESSLLSAANLIDATTCVSLFPDPKCTLAWGAAHFPSIGTGSQDARKRSLSLNRLCCGAPSLGLETIFTLYLCRWTGAHTATSSTTAPSPELQVRPLLNGRFHPSPK